MTYWTPLGSLFEKQAAAHPDKAALNLASGPVSFAGLARLAQRGQALLTQHGVTRGDVVGLHLGKSVETYALMLGALRLGAPYVCLDPASPEPRLQRMLERAQPRLLISASAIANPFGGSLQSRGDTWSAQWPQSDEPADTSLTGTHPAYIMFTSGSTGEPKGTVIPHQGVASLIRWGARFAGPERDTVFSGVNPLHFDNSVFDFYGSLWNGCTLAPVETARLPNPALWIRALKAQGASLLFAVPTFFLMLDEIGLLTPEALPNLRIAMFGGEGFPIQRLRDFYTRFEDRARLVNVYGPTETSCICSSLDIDADALKAAGSGFVSLGRMHDGFDCAVLDENETPVSPGETGELWIGGGNVGLGYVNNPEETARRFREDPRAPGSGTRFYRTGDLVREDREARLWFAGRADNQIKIRGHRVELEEIDHVAGLYPGLRRACAVFLSHANGGEIVLAYESGDSADEAGLKDWCAKHLPAYMRPARLAAFASLPVNANGKLDRRAVRALLSPQTEG